MNQNYQIIKGLSAAWRFSVSSWELLLILFSFNLIFSSLIISPFKSLIASSLDKRLTPDRLNFTFLSDLFSDHSFSFNSQFTLLFVGCILYLIWLIFATAGISFYTQRKNANLSDFWNGATNYFWKFLRLTVYMLVIISGLLFIAFQFFNLGETNIFAIESEQIFIRRATLIIPFIALFYTLIKLWNDSLKIAIARSSHQTWYFNLALRTWLTIFNKRLIFTFVINILITLLLLIVLLGVKKMCQHYFLVFCISQLTLLIRLIYKIANLKTISDLTNDEAPLLS